MRNLDRHLNQLADRLGRNPRDPVVHCPICEGFGLVDDPNDPNTERQADARIAARLVDLMRDMGSTEAEVSRFAASLADIGPWDDPRRVRCSRCAGTGRISTSAAAALAREEAAACEWFLDQARFDATTNR